MDARVTTDTRVALRLGNDERGEDDEGSYSEAIGPETGLPSDSDVHPD
jgi:hypothetical protein